jgi:hypothetical protein
VSAILVGEASEESFASHAAGDVGDGVLAVPVASYNLLLKKKIL